MADEWNETTDALTAQADAPALTPLKNLFCGAGYHSIDDKNRVKFPSEIRSQLASTPFRLAKGTNRVVYVYPEDTARVKLNEVGKLLESGSLDLRTVKKLRKYVASFTTPVEVDAQERFILPQWIMDWANLSKKDQIVTIGFIDHFEIWKAEDYKAYEEDDGDDDDISYEEALASIKVY